MRTVERGSREPSTSRRAISILGTLGLVTGMLAVGVQGAGAVVNTCRAKNVTQATRSRSDLQDVVDAAEPGDRIAVRFVCVGNFRIDKDLTLVGRPTPDLSRPVLTANGKGGTLMVAARVTLVNLKVVRGSRYSVANRGTLTLRRSLVRDGCQSSIVNRGALTLRRSAVSNGYDASCDGIGGGISNYGTVTLHDTSSVRGNANAYTGGGIYNAAGGTVTLNDSSSVRGNRAAFAGGIDNRGTLILNDSSSVSGNRAWDSGGIYNGTGATVTLSDASSVSGNRASDGSGGGSGGGISNYGTVTLRDSSSVSGNTADSGGGILNDGGTVNVCDETSLHQWVGAISPNTPDDPPAVTPIPCT